MSTSSSLCPGLCAALGDAIPSEDFHPEEISLERNSNVLEGYESQGLGSLANLRSAIEEVSRGVSETTYKAYLGYLYLFICMNIYLQIHCHRQMKAFDSWLTQKNYLHGSNSIFLLPRSEELPHVICQWIMESFVVNCITLKCISNNDCRCDPLNLDGSEKDPTVVQSSFSHAMKMRAALTYGFGYGPFGDNSPWRMSDDGRRLGSPSVSQLVGAYMTSLRRRKVRLHFSC